MRTCARHLLPAGRRVPSIVAVCLVGLALVGGCGSTPSRRTPADPSVEHELLRGVGEIRGTRDRRALRAELGRVLVHLRAARPTTATTRRGRDLAIRGFAATLEGIESQLEFSENDSGEVAEATIDAKRADRYLRRGANLLRAAGEALGVRIGELNGY